jgi:hypothetical protein
MTPPLPRLAAALHAAERGWPVFPVYSYSKYPAVPDWEHRATRDLDQITRWWQQAAFNIGIACRPAGLVVLDLDAGHGQLPPRQWARLGVRHGRDVLAVLADRAGQPDPVDTYTVATPSVIDGALARLFSVCDDRYSDRSSLLIHCYQWVFIDEMERQPLCSSRRYCGLPAVCGWSHRGAACHLFHKEA